MWKTENVYFIKYYEFDALVEEHLGIEYNIVANEELLNDSLCDLGIVPCKYWDDRDETRLASVLSGKHHMHVSWLLAQALHRKRIMPAGQWIVKISW